MAIYGGLYKADIPVLIMYKAIVEPVLDPFARQRGATGSA